MYVAYVAVSAIVPSLLLMWYFHVRDTFPEPPRVVWTTFVLGVVIVMPVVLMAWPFDHAAEKLTNPFLYGLASAFLAAAIPEELFKLVVLWRYAARHLEFDEPMDGVVYGVAASLGFATLENILYVSQGGLGVAALRALTAIPGHAFLGAIMGYYVGQARFATSGRRGLLAKAFVVPVVWHGLYDFPLLTSMRADDLSATQEVWLYLLLLTVPAILIGEWVWCRRRIRGLRRDQRHLAADAAAVAPLTPLAPQLPPIPASADRGDGGHFSRLVAAAGTVLGGLLASGGGLMTLGVVVGVLFLGAEADELAPLAVGTAILGGLPLILGLLLFRWGVRRLNQT